MLAEGPPDGARWATTMNSKGLFAYERRTDMDFHHVAAGR